MKNLLVLALLPLAGWGITLRDLQQPATEVVYKAGQRLYVFTAKEGEARPALVWMHGGGWTSGEASAGFPQARYFAARGMTAISVEYRLAKPGGPWIRDAVADCRDAVKYVRAHAAELHVDPTRIAVAGDSAGAHLAASAADLAGAMVLYNGIYDLTVDDRTALTGSVEASREVSPIFHVPARIPPTIVLHGRKDTSVSVEQSKRYAEALQARLVLFENARHAFVLPGYTAPEHQVVDALREADEFLRGIGYLTGPPTLETAAPLPVPRAGNWMTRHEKVLERVREGKADVVFLGDSITQNYEKTKEPDENFKPTWDRFYGDRNAVNMGFSGDMTDHLLWRIEHGELDGIRPKLVVILIGTNDLAHGHSAETTKAGIDEIVYLTHVKVPSAKVLLLGILPSDFGEQRTAATNEVNRYLATKYAGSKYVTFADIGDVFLRDRKLDTSLFYDPRLPKVGKALHPDTKGQRLMAEKIEPLVCAALGDCRAR